MRIFYYSLGLAVALCLIGFSTVVFFGEREFGIKLFQGGFFFGGFSAVLIMLTSNSSRFGILGPELKILGSGFGLILIGLLFNAIFDLDSWIKNSFFYSGMIVMTVGVTKSLLKLR